jgi:hypothetical protein
VTEQKSAGPIGLPNRVSPQQSRHPKYEGPVGALILNDQVEWLHQDRERTEWVNPDHSICCGLTALGRQIVDSERYGVAHCVPSDGLC